MRCFTIVVLLLASCGGDELEPTLSSIQENVFTPQCAGSGCHSGANPGGSLDLTDGKSHAALVGVDSAEVAGQKRVVAGDAAASLLVDVLTGQAPSSVRKMPVGRSLEDAEIEAIRNWVNDGAKND